MAKRRNSPPGDEPTTTQQAIDAAVQAAEVLDGPPPDEDAAVQIILSPTHRKRLLGRLAEFELGLLKLAPLQQSFVMAYVSDPTDGAAAARKAGYSERRAAATACDLLSRP